MKAWTGAGDGGDHSKSSIQWGGRQACSVGPHGTLSSQRLTHHLYSFYSWWVLSERSSGIDFFLYLQRADAHAAMSNSLRPHGLEPTRLLCPWGGGGQCLVHSPGKNTGVAISSSRGSSQPRDWTRISCISCIAGRFFTAEPLGKPIRCW